MLVLAPRKIIMKSHPGVIMHFHLWRDPSHSISGVNLEAWGSVLTWYPECVHWKLIWGGLFVDLLERKGNWGTQIKEQRVFNCWFPHKCSQSQGWARSKQGSRHSIQVFYIGDQNSAVWAVACCLPGSTWSGTWDRELGLGMKYGYFGEGCGHLNYMVMHWPLEQDFLSCYGLQQCHSPGTGFPFPTPAQLQYSSKKAGRPDVGNMETFKNPD